MRRDRWRDRSRIPLHRTPWKNGEKRRISKLNFSNIKRKLFSKFTAFAKPIRIKTPHRSNPRKQFQNDLLHLNTRHEISSFFQFWNGPRANIFFTFSNRVMQTEWSIFDFTFIVFAHDWCPFHKSVRMSAVISTIFSPWFMKNSIYSRFWPFARWPGVPRTNSAQFGNGPRAEFGLHRCRCVGGCWWRSSPVRPLSRRSHPN